MSIKGLERRIKQHVKAKPHQFFAICQPGFEDVFQNELLEICQLQELNVVEGGIEFSAKINDCYKINLSSRGATRIIMRLVKFKVIYFEKLSAKLEEFPWELYLKKNTELSFNIKCHHSRLYHTGRIETEFRKAINKRLNSEIFIEEKNEKVIQTIHVRFDNDLCTVSLDSSGEPLYKRGYKTHITEAPIRETLAALILKSININKYDALIDPMCGSGTIAIEAAMIVNNILPAIKRKFAFENWPVFSEANFRFIKKEQVEKNKNEEITFKQKIYASDIDEQVISIARHNALELNLPEEINFKTVDFFSLGADDFNTQKMFFVFNPPYGKRIAEHKNISSFYRKIGKKIRKDFNHAGFAIIVPGIDNEKALGLNYNKKTLFMNGGVKVAILIKE